MGAMVERVISGSVREGAFELRRHEKPYPGSSSGIDEIYLLRAADGRDQQINSLKSIP